MLNTLKLAKSLNFINKYTLTMTNSYENVSQRTICDFSQNKIYPKFFHSKGHNNVSENYAKQLIETVSNFAILN